MAKTPSPSETTSGSSKSFISSPWIWWASAALSLALGYSDLWRGGEGTASALLVLGYLVFVPIAILKR